MGLEQHEKASDDSIPTPFKPITTLSKNVNMLDWNPVPQSDVPAFEPKPNAR